MSAPCRIQGRLEARALAANAVRLAYHERFGASPGPEDRLWLLDPCEKLALVGAVELRLGVTFRDEDIEFLDSPDDLVERGVAVLLDPGRAKPGRKVLPWL